MSVAGTLISFLGLLIFLAGEPMASRSALVTGITDHRSLVSFHYIARAVRAWAAHYLNSMTPLPDRIQLFAGDGTYLLWHWVSGTSCPIRSWTAERPSLERRAP